MLATTGGGGVMPVESPAFCLPCVRGIGCGERGRRDGGGSGWRWRQDNCALLVLVCDCAGERRHS